MEAHLTDLLTLLELRCNCSYRFRDERWGAKLCECCQAVAAIRALQELVEEAQSLFGPPDHSALDALWQVSAELCALVSPPFDGVRPPAWPDKLNDADRRCLTDALHGVRELLDRRDAWLQSQDTNP